MTSFGLCLACGKWLRLKGCRLFDVAWLKEGEEEEEEGSGSNADALSPSLGSGLLGVSFFGCAKRKLVASLLAC